MQGLDGKIFMFCNETNKESKLGKRAQNKFKGQKLLVMLS